MAQRSRVLVVDDEQPLARVIGSYLEADGFEVDLAFNGSNAVVSARDHRPDLVVLDLMLPGIDGVEVCRQIRTFSDCYIIMLTARDEELDKIIGLSVGADDYLVKPFSPRELVARARAMLRRPRTFESSPGRPVGAEGQLLQLGSLTVDPLARKVQVNDGELELTRTEFDLLAVMCANPRQVFSRRQLIDAVWGPDWFGDEHLVDVHVGHVRRKLGDHAAEPRWIRTVRGVGYGMVV